MPRLNAANLLPKMLAKLTTERKTHLAAIEKHQEKLSEIEAIFAGCGLKLEDAPAKRGRKPGRKPGRKAGRKPRGTFKLTGIESVLAFIKKAGKPTAAEVNKHWSGEGRGGKADNTLSKLVTDGKLKRIEDPAVRGSRYAMA